MKSKYKDGNHGFVIHDACWCLLQKASHPFTIPLENIILVCESFPVPIWTTALNWGHEYGGYMELDIEGSYPWLECLERRSIAYIQDRGIFLNPLAGLNFDELQNLGSSETLVQNKTTLQPRKEHPDVFSQLPWELCEMICFNLATEDALNLRLASLTFLPLVSSFRFWFSRFEPDGEKGFLFEVREQQKYNLEASTLSQLYRASRKLSEDRCLLNRDRVWRLARQALPLFMFTGLPAQVPSGGPQTLQSSPLDQNRWIRLTGEEHDLKVNSHGLTKPLETGCISLKTTELSIRSCPLRLGIAFVNLGRWDYITGIRIRDEDGREQMAGCGFDNMEVVYDIASLAGFRVCVGPSGLRALQPVDRQQISHPWVGRTENVPTSNRLVADTPLTALRISLDASS